MRQGFKAPGALEKVKLYDSYLHKMDKALIGNDWLVGDKFSIADIALTPYVQSPCNDVDARDVGRWTFAKFGTLV